MHLLIRSILFIVAMMSPTTALGDNLPAIAIHGGAGAKGRGAYSLEEDAAFRAALTEALNIGFSVLQDGGSSLDAVEQTIRNLEDNPLFNAGRGSVFTASGTNELDASIMDGATLNSGAVAGVKVVKNPISLSRRVMEASPHVMFAGEGADSFAKEQGLEIVEPSFFRTERRWNDYQKRLNANTEKHGALPADYKFGTVGAVAVDAKGNLAAGTSTGGRLMKRWGRVGDSPIIGAGTYADNASCAVSATGAGEYFIRATVARDICARVELQNMSIADAANEVIFQRLTNIGGTGGVIVIDANGDIAFAFNTAAMFRGYRKADQPPTVAIYSDED